MSGGPPQANNFHVFQQQSSFVSATRAAKSADQKAAKIEKEWRKAVSSGDRGKAMRLQRQMDSATKESTKQNKKAKNMEKSFKKKGWFN